MWRRCWPSGGTAWRFDVPPSGFICQYKDVEYWIYFKDHPRPHFTAYVDGQKYKYEIHTFKSIGKAPQSQELAKRIRRGFLLNEQRIIDAWYANAEPYLPEREDSEPMPKSQQRARDSKRRRK